MKKQVTACIVLFAMLFSACGGQKVTDPKPPVSLSEGSEPEEMRWNLEETRLPDGDEALADILPEEAGKPYEMLFAMRGDTLYRVTDIWGEEFKATCIQKLEAPYTQWESAVISADEWMEGKSCYAQYASLGADGVQLLLKELGEDGGWYWAEWGEKAEGLAEPTELENLGDDFFNGFKSFYKAADGTVYFSMAAGVQYFDENFQEKKEWVDPGDVWQFAEMAGEEGEKGGNLYFLGNSIDGKFRIWTVGSREPVAASDEVFMSFDSRAVFEDKQEGYLCTPYGIWRFSLDGSPKGEEMENLLLFEREGYSVEWIYGASVNQEGNLLMAVLVDGEYLLLERKADENWQNKKQLELVTSWADPFLKKAVADFNRQSDEYYVVLVERGEDENWLDFNTRIQVEIGSGGGPALVTEDVINAYDGAKNGYLLDLTEELAEERGRMPENVWASGEVDGRCFAAPYSFCVETLVVSADVAAGREYWTMEEFMECVRESGAETAVSRMDGAQLFARLVLLSDWGNLIDWEEGKSYLDSAEAVELLEFTGAYGSDDMLEDSIIRVAEGRTLAKWETLYGLDSFGVCAVEAIFQGEAVYIGYPTEDYPQQSGSILQSKLLLVNKSCEYPEGAVAFIRYLLSSDVQKWLAEKSCEGMTYILPVDSGALEYAFRYTRELSEKKEPSWAAVDDFEFTSGPVSEESWAKVEKMVMTASPQTLYSGGVETIIFEEMGAYFAGDRTAQETCDIMQSRVQLYLDEIR